MPSKSKRQKKVGKQPKDIQRKPSRFLSSDAVRVAALVLASILVAIVASELVVRLVYGGKFGPRPGFYVADQRLGWMPNASLDHTFYGPDFEIDIRTDADGYRLGALGEVDYSKQLVVVCGDSYAFGWGVGTDETFPSYLDELVYEASAGQQRVVNLGVGGYGLFQSGDRFYRFSETHPNVDVKTVVIQHTVNDAMDNVKAIGYHVEFWETKTTLKSRSRFHLVNLIGYVRQVLNQRGSAASQEETDENHPYVQDLLWSYRRQGRAIRLPSAVDFDGRIVGLDREGFEAGQDVDALMRNQKLTRLQLDFMREAIHGIHSVCASYGAKAVHVFVATTPEWYLQEVRDLVLESADFVGVNAVVLGALPAPEEFDGPITTGHSGGHFNADFNRLWAERVAAALNENVR